MNLNRPESFKAQILIVDDTLANVTYICTMLADFGYIAQGVNTAADALAAATRELPDLILLDITLPDGNGYDVCQRLKANPATKDIPIIFLSGMGSPLDKIKAFELGGVDYITKPFEIDEVLARIENHLTIQRLQLALQQANATLEAKVSERTEQLTATVTQLKEQITEREQAEAALQQHAERLRQLYQIDQAILAAKSPVEISLGVLHHLKHMIPCQRASLTIFNFNANEVTIWLLNPDGNSELDIESSMSLADFGGLEDLREGKPYIVKDVSAHLARSSTGNQFLGEGIQSVINVPLMEQDKLIGSLNIGGAEPDIFTAEHLALTREVAAPLAVAISQARLYESEAQRRREAEALSDIAAALNSTLSLDNVFQRILDNIDQIVAHDAAHIMIIDSGLARIASQQGYSTYRVPADLAAEHFVVADFPFLDRIIKTRRPLVISNTQTSSDWIARKDIQWVHSYIGVPICKQDEVIGIINLGSAIPNTFTENIADDLRAFADQAAVALDNAHLHEALQERMQLLQETQTQLVHSEMMSALGRLVASITHEINNPMQSVQTCLTLAKEILADSQSPEKLKRYLSIVEEEIDRVTDILHRMREFYRPARDGLSLVDLPSVLSSILALVNKHMQHNNVNVESVWPDDIVSIEANADQLKQVFLNLILNALDAMPEGGLLRIHLKPDQIAKEGDQLPKPAVRLEISDSGIGMSQEIQERIFEPFFTTKSNGSGLGLSITYGMIKTLNGQISVVSEEDQGTTFTIILPTAQPSDTEAFHGHSS